MPASHERVPNRPLSGLELAQIIEKDVKNILQRDGMLSNNVAFSRVSFEVRVSIHMDNPIYPEHVITVHSRPPAVNVLPIHPELAALESAPLSDGEGEGPELSEDETVFSVETHRQVASPNMARVENGMPIKIEKRNMDTGQVELKDQKFTGDMPDPLSVGNLTQSVDTSEDQRAKWNKPKKERHHGH